MTSNQLAFRVPFFRFPNYLRMLCLKRGHLGRVTYTVASPCCFGMQTCIFQLEFPWENKRFVSKQGQPRPRPQLKARVLTKQLKNGLLEATLLGPLLPPRNSSYCCFLQCKICFSFANLRNTTLASSLFILLLNYIDSKQRKQINNGEFVNCGFRSVVVITSASHAEGRQFKSGRKHFTFFFKLCKSVQIT